MVIGDLLQTPAMQVWTGVGARGGPGESVEVWKMWEVWGQAVWMEFRPQAVGCRALCAQAHPVQVGRLSRVLYFNAPGSSGSYCKYSGLPGPYLKAGVSACLYDMCRPTVARMNRPGPVLAHRCGLRVHC